MKTLQIKAIVVGKAHGNCDEPVDIPVVHALPAGLTHFSDECVTRCSEQRTMFHFARTSEFIIVQFFLTTAPGTHSLCIECRYSYAYVEGTPTARSFQALVTAPIF